MARGRFTLDAGKQFIRWGKADIVNPTDRFAPKDFLNVVDAEFLAVTGLRGVVRLGMCGEDETAVVRQVEPLVPIASPGVRKLEPFDLVPQLGARRGPESECAVHVHPTCAAGSRRTGVPVDELAGFAE